MPRRKFGGGDKCPVCTKTVYLNEKLMFDAKVFHKLCFKCSICNKRIESPNSAGSMDGKIFHRKCFERQFAESGGKYGGQKVTNRSKQADQPVHKPTPAPRPAPAPSPAGQATSSSQPDVSSGASVKERMALLKKKGNSTSNTEQKDPSAKKKKRKKNRFGGGDKCAICTKSVYLNERLGFEGKVFHKLCFKCSICNKTINDANSAGSMGGSISHRACFSRQFSESGGKYGGEKVRNKAQREAAATEESPEPEAEPTPEPEPEPAPAPEPTAEPAPEPETEQKEEKKEEKKAAKKKKKRRFGAAKSNKPVPGTIDTKQRGKIFVEKFDARLQTEPVRVEIPEGDLNTGVFVGHCKGGGNPLTVIISGKCKNVTISTCENIAVVFDTCITTVELINCKKLQVQSLQAAGSFIVDKCDRTTVYPSKASCDEKVVMVSCMSTATNVVQPPENEDEGSKEHPVPDQIQSIFIKNTPPAHSIILPEG